MEIGQKLKYFREKKNLSLRELGRLAHVSHSFIKDIESGRSNPSLATSKSLADALRVTIAELMGETPTPPQPRINDKPTFEIMAEYVLDAVGLGEASIKISELNNKYDLDKETFLEFHKLAFEKFDLKPTKQADKNASHLKKDIPVSGVFKKGGGKDGNKR